MEKVPEKIELSQISHRNYSLRFRPFLMATGEERFQFLLFFFAFFIVIQRSSRILIPAAGSHEARPNSNLYFFVELMVLS
jgi:hypothetical protein